MQVLFENSAKKKRNIGTASSMQDAMKVISDFLNQHNYKSYYKRVWKVDEKTTKVDVGSHTEFFYIIED